MSSLTDSCNRHGTKACVAADLIERLENEKAAVVTSGVCLICGFTGVCL